MTGRLRLLIVVLVVLAGLYAVVMRVASPQVPLWARRLTSDTRKPAIEPDPYPTDYEELTVLIEIPPLSEFPDPWANRVGCPHKRLMRVLAAAIAPGNGCPVLELDPEGAAAKAGIQRLDRLGGPEQCAASIYEYFIPEKDAHTVEWTVRRPRNATARSLERPSRSPT